MLYLKLDGQKIIGHDYYQHDDYNFPINESPIVYLEGEFFGKYKYKVVNGILVNLERHEIDTSQDYIGKRSKEYPSTEELIVALWEKLVEGRPESANALQAKREQVKQKYPKP